MNAQNIPMFIAAGFLALMFVITITTYNRLVALRRRCDQAEADIDVQLKLRHDLIPNLVETVKGYASHERGTLEAVIKARGAAIAAPSPGAEAALGGALGRLLAVAEAYPDLQANQRFAALQDEMGDIENKIAAARRYMNNATNEYNTQCEVFPATIIAGLFGFDARNSGAVAKEQRQILDAAPAVKF